MRYRFFQTESYLSWNYYGIYAVLLSVGHCSVERYTQAVDLWQMQTSRNFYYLFQRSTLILLKSTSEMLWAVWDNPLGFYQTYLKDKNSPPYWKIDLLQDCTVLKISVLYLFCKERSKIVNGSKKIKYPHPAFTWVTEKSTEDPVNTYVSFAGQWVS